MSRLSNYLQVGLRPVAATQMLWAHRRTLAHLLKRRKFSQFGNFIDVTYLVRGEDCGKGILDPVWYFAPRLVPAFWDIELEITTACPLRCRMCENRYFPESYRNQNLPYGRFAQIVDSIPNLKWINLTGEGSPLMNPGFMPMLRYAKQIKNLYVDFSHDFYTYNDHIGQEWIDLGIERIYFSVDGCTRVTYESVRQGSDFDRVISNVKQFIELKRRNNSPLPELCFRFAFFKDNAHEVQLMPSFVASLGSPRDLGDEPSLNIVGLLEFAETKGLEVELSPEAIEETNRRAKRAGIKLYWSHVTHDESQKPPAHFCVFWTEPYIMITGHVVPDCAVLMSNRRPFLEAHSFGNVKDMPLPEMWRTPKYEQFRETLRDPGAPIPSICLGCRVYETEFRAKKYGVWDMSEAR